MRGQDTPVAVVAEFRAHYLYSGNAAESARKVKLPESTGACLARVACADPEFIAARRALRAQFLEDLVAKRQRVANKALERFEAEYDVGPGEIDSRPAFGKLVLEAEKNAHSLAKLEAGVSEAKSQPTEVHIHIVDDKPAGDDDSES